MEIHHFVIDHIDIFLFVDEAKHLALKSASEGSIGFDLVSLDIITGRESVSAM